MSGPGPVRAYVGLGANLGDAEGTVRAALAALAAAPGLSLVAESSLFRTGPIDATGPDFFNAVAAVDCTLAAEAVLDTLQSIEDRFGRERPYRNAPRTLDLDLLLYGNAVMDTPRLILPHPRAHQRAFVLAPLAELAPGLDLPGHGPVERLLAGVADQAIERIVR